MYSELVPERILDTIAALERRIAERFPESGLSRVSRELQRLGNETRATTEKLRRPIWPLRISAGLGILSMAAIILGVAILAFRISVEGRDASLQVIESAINEIILLAIAIFFMVSLETRVKRREALRSLHRLRSLIHIIDMHQLTKDPERAFAPAHTTASPTKSPYTRFELARYLEYCSELLSLANKLAALHVQYVNDPVVLSAVNDIETLVAGLSNKIWQKIMIIDVVMPPALDQKAAGQESLSPAPTRA